MAEEEQLDVEEIEEDEEIRNARSGLEALEDDGEPGQDEIGEALPEFQKEEDEGEEKSLFQPWVNPIKAANEEESEEDRLLFYKERQCILLVLEARKLLASMIAIREKQDQEAWDEKIRKENMDKIISGRLSVQEIQELLQSQAEDDDSDLVLRIQELKKQLVIEIRRNHVLDRDLQKLDKRISLLIKNKGSIQDVIAASKGLKSNKKRGEAHDFAADPRKVENYQNLFYLLQTEPRYLARCLFLVNAEQMESFLETTILTLYGDAFTPREEFLILKLFQLAIQHEISVVKHVGDFLSSDTVVPKMVITYNRRKQGLEYLKRTLAPLLSVVIERNDLNLELHPLQIYNAMINETEIKTGEKSSLERNVTEDQAAQNTEVQKIVKERLADLENLSQQFLDGILDTMRDLPYGIRWICKQLRDLATKALPDATKDDILKLEVYFVYYRFINLAIVTPDAYNVIEGELPQSARKNLVVVAKVLQNVFNLKEFSAQEKYMLPLNTFISKNKSRLIRYFEEMPKVDDPEDYLQVNKYMELTHKTKPVILISLDEIYKTHSLIAKHLDGLAPDKEDPLRKIMIDLGPPPASSGEEDDREIQLTLTNRFKVEVEEESEIQRLYAETKELVIPILRLVPIQNTIQRLNLMDVLEAGIKYATETNNKNLSNQINKILENMGKLEKEEVISKDDNYESFVHDVALEVANRSVIREQQRKEIARLTLTLDNLRKYQKYVTDQITDYNRYLQDCLEKQYSGKKGKGGLIGPFKFSYKDLQKKGVILDSEVPPLSRGKTQFLISSEGAGLFDIVAKIAGIKVEKMQLHLDDLLERHYNNINRLELDQVTLDVNMTIHLVNKLFRNKK
jgi:Ras GTPase-activating-like protein IQGAP2/3